MRTRVKAFVSAGSLVFVIVLLVLLVFWRSTIKFGADTSSGDNNTGVQHPVSGSAEVVFAVEAAIARKGDLVKRLTTTGTLRAWREVQMVARVGGNIIAVPVQNGDYVRAGQLLLRTDDTEYRLALERATTALLGAQIEFKSMISYDPTVILDSSTTGSDSLRFKEKIKEARKGLESLEKEYAEGKVSFAEHARAKRDYESDIAYFTAYRGDVMANKSGLSQARETYERSKLDFDATRITAPFAGYIANLELSSGMKISAGKELFKLVDVSSLFVDVDVLETEVGKVHPGRTVDVTVPAYPEHKFAGTVVAMNPIVDPKSKTVKVTIELKDGRWKSSSEARNRNAELTLRPGMFATVRIETDIFENRIIVPKSALLVRDQRTLVFYKEGDLAKWDYIDVGEDNEESIEIVRGQDKEIVPGDTILIGGHYTLAHDAKIRVVGKAK